MIILTLQKNHCIKSDYQSVWTFCRSVEYTLSSGSINGERREKEQQQQNVGQSAFFCYGTTISLGLMPLHTHREEMGRPVDLLHSVTLSSSPVTPIFCFRPHKRPSNPGPCLPPLIYCSSHWCWARYTAAYSLSFLLAVALQPLFLQSACTCRITPSHWRKWLLCLLIFVHLVFAQYSHSAKSLCRDSMASRDSTASPFWYCLQSYLLCT